MGFATWLFMVGFAYGLGVSWYGLLLGRLPDLPWRVAAYPFILMVLAEAFVPVGPSFLGFHPGIAVIASFIGVVIDWLTARYRHPKATTSFEVRVSAAKS